MRSPMRECWPDGKLRAFLDRELPAEELSRLSAHLEECPECGSRYRELSARAGRVMDLVGGLAEPCVANLVPRPTGKPFAPARPRGARWKIAAAAAAALAAGWAALALLSPKPVEAPVVTRFDSPRVVETPHVADIPIPIRSSPARRPVRVAPRRFQPALPSAAPRATLAGFVALDDDPIDAGVVMRVVLANGRMQADVIYSPDGRPRAIRLVNDGTGK